ncbi:hypothetical protein E2C01_065327 [Portunus trituberculatus]|uniref:Uncharacterized protein n=1 Tax=Portunus trituberculatus TaxID=210409 RepID=A0A5B7HMP8_PORTR|nr:hypothetical protein [Portunus trituberculatus]
MGVSWTAGQADQFLKVARDWWDQSVVRGQRAPVPRPSAKPKTPLLPVGDSLDTRVGVWLSERSPLSFPPPLATPSSETALLTAEILTVLSLRQDLNARVSSSLLCSNLLPLLRFTLWQGAPAMASSFTQALSSHLTCWRQAVAPLPSVAQLALLMGDPLGASFGSTQTVADALARSPQVAVV